MGTEGQDELQWYVLRAIGGRERKVKRHIENEVARLHLEESLASVLVPVEKTVGTRNGKKVMKEVLLYPSYVFIEAVLTPHVLELLRETPDALGFLAMSGEAPAPLRPAEVNRMLGRIDELVEQEGVLEVPFQVGEEVRVCDGPFNTFTGVVSEVHEEKCKLVVLVQIFDRKTPLELTFLQVERL